MRVICKVFCFLQKQNNTFLAILIVPNSLQHGLAAYSAHDRGLGEQQWREITMISVQWAAAI